MIPEFIGRLPIIATLRELDKEALIKILVEPKNALVKQYQKLFQIDDVELCFEQDAIEAIVEKAIERKTGARGLRAILEKSLMNVMFDIPSDDSIGRCIITKEVVEGKAQPELVYRDDRRKAGRSIQNKGVSETA